MKHREKRQERDKKKKATGDNKKKARGDEPIRGEGSAKLDSVTAKDTSNIEPAVDNENNTPDPAHAAESSTKSAKKTKS